MSERSADAVACRMLQDSAAAMNILLDLFITFFKIGLFTFGGGYALIAFIEHICVEQKHWVSHDEMMNITVIAESTPGPMALNCATYVGYRQGGLIGSVLSTCGMILPSFGIIFLISVWFDRFLEIEWIAHAFAGIKIAVGLLILDAALKMIKKMPKKTMPKVTVLCAFAAMLLINIFSVRISSIVLMITAGIVSLLIFCIRKPEGKEEMPK